MAFGYFLGAVLIFFKEQWLKVIGAIIATALFAYIEGHLKKRRLQNELNLLLAEKKTAEDVIDEEKLNHSSNKETYELRLKVFHEELSKINKKIADVSGKLDSMRKKEQLELNVGKEKEEKLKKKIAKEKILEVEGEIKAKEKAKEREKEIKRISTKVKSLFGKAEESLKKVDKAIDRSMEKSKAIPTEGKEKQAEIIHMIAHGNNLLKAGKLKDARKAYNEVRELYSSLGWRSKKQVESSILQFYQKLSK